MSARPGSSEQEDARLDALRRRLYRPDATDADRQRYAAERATVIHRAPAADAAEPTAAGEAPEPTAARTARTSRWAVVVAAVVLAGLAGVVIGQRIAPAERTARPAPTPVVQQDFGNGQRFSVDTSGVSGPTRVATSVQGTPVTGQSFRGRGSAVVPVDPLPGIFDGGRALVVLTAAQPAPAEWRALSVITRNDFSSFPVVMAQGTTEPGSVVATPSTFVFPASPPARIAVEAPADVRWTLVVAATSRIADELR